MKQKKLKLRIVKFDRMLAVEQIERTVLIPATAKHFQEIEDMGLYLENSFMRLPQVGGIMATVRYFDSNAERDEYLQKVFGWISDELFGEAAKLEVGKMCEVSDDGKKWAKRIYAGEILPPLDATFKFLTSCGQSDEGNYVYFSWKYARPLSVQLTIDGDIYTWEDK